VEILPAIIPEAYYSDVFVSIHINSTDNSVSGFVISTPYIDYSGKADKLKLAIIEEYSKISRLKRIDNVSKNMTHYYAFNSSRYKKAIHL